MKERLVGLVSAAAAILINTTIVTSALAGELTGTAEPKLSPIQLNTTAVPTFAEYRVSITNPGAATINGWRFVARTSVLGGTSRATFYQAGSDARCAQGSSDTEVVCQFATISPGVPPVSFSVAFNAPADGTKINLSWRAFWDESGNGGADGFKNAQETLLEPPDINKLSSVVPKGSNSLTFYTGSSNGAATSTDDWVTVVTVPGGLAESTIATINETVVLGGCASNLLTCATTRLNLPGTFGTEGTGTSTSFNGLQITLRRDASTIKPGAKIDSAIIKYSEPTSPNTLAGDYPITVPSCTNTDYGSLPKLGIPCEDRTKRKAYPKKSTPKESVPADFEGDWEFVIYAIDNGKYDQ